MALVAALSDAGLRHSEAAALTWGDVQHWDDGSGRITVVHSKTDAEAQGAVGGRHPRRHGGAGRHPAGWCRRWGEGLRAVGVPDRPACEGHRQGRGLSEWEYFSGRVGMARRMAQNGAPTHETQRRAAGNRAAAWSTATPAAKPQGQHCGIYRSVIYLVKQFRA